MRRIGPCVGGLVLAGRRCACGGAAVRENAGWWSGLGDRSGRGYPCEVTCAARPRCKEVADGVCRVALLRSGGPCEGGGVTLSARREVGVGQIFESVIRAWARASRRSGVAGQVWVASALRGDGVVRRRRATSDVVDAAVQPVDLDRVASARAELEARRSADGGARRDRRGASGVRRVRLTAQTGRRGGDPLWGRAPARTSVPVVGRAPGERGEKGRRRACNLAPRSDHFPGSRGISRLGAGCFCCPGGEVGGAPRRLKALAAASRWGAASPVGAGGGPRECHRGLPSGIITGVIKLRRG